MDHLLEVLRVSVDNAQRKAATVRLQHLQSQDPSLFLDHTWAGISSPAVSLEERFFLCSVVAAFVEGSWHHGVPAALQAAVLHRYSDFVVHTRLPSLGFARKLAGITALMAKRGAGRAQPRGLPPLLDSLASTYANALTDACGGEIAVDGGGGGQAVSLFFHSGC
ncbi:unnamed protein product [Phytomonas sp. EM1]|nr:unnamed protein product [Phytomonas sp. EM1]|eukprot:CCW64100.1 unnamed protein product [Phytomonas sp. isolate EM1]